MVLLAASQAGGKPAANSAAEVKTETPPQRTESSDVGASGGVKQESVAAAVAGEPTTSATEATTAGKDVSEDKAVTVEDSDGEEKMDSDANEQKKIEDDKEEVCPMVLYLNAYVLIEVYDFLFVHRAALWSTAGQCTCSWGLQKIPSHTELYGDAVRRSRTCLTRQ